jgi:hypothetical protein
MLSPLALLISHLSFFLRTMAASHPEQFQPSFVDEGELLKLIEKHLLPDRVMIQWRSAKDEEIPTPHTKEIMVLAAFF